MLWHISDNTSSLTSFLREGAKSVGIGEGGQQNGFYVWSDKVTALKHAKAMLNGMFTNKPIKETALLIGVPVNKKDIQYPAWQLDLEATKGLFDLWCQYGDFLNKHAQNISIPVHSSSREWKDIETITKISYEKIIKKEPNIYEEFIHFHLKRKDGRETHKIMWEDIDNGADTFKAEAITRYLCENNPLFLNKYNALLEHIAYTGETASLKYTGKQPLKVDNISLLKKEKDETIKEYPLHIEKENPEMTICPLTKKRITDKTR